MTNGRDALIKLIIGSDERLSLQIARTQVKTKFLRKNLYLDILHESYWIINVEKKVYKHLERKVKMVTKWENSLQHLKLEESRIVSVFSWGTRTASLEFCTKTYNFLSYQNNILKAWNL